MDCSLNVEIVSTMSKEWMKEAAAARNRDLQVKLEKEVTQSTKVCFRISKYSHIQSEKPKRTKSGT